MIQPDARLLFDRAAPPPRAGAGLLAAAMLALAGATAAIARGYPVPGGGLLLAGLLLDGLAGAALRRAGPGPFARLAQAPVMLFLPAFGFALADPSRALAALLLVTGLAVLTSLRENNLDNVKIGVGAGYVLGCIFPNYFSITAYVIGVACFVLAGRSVARPG